MTGAPLTAGLLLAAVALGLGHAQTRTLIAAAATAAGLAIVAALIVPPIEPGAAFAGSWISLILTCVPIYRPQIMSSGKAWIALSSNAGVWAGLTVNAAHEPMQIIFAILALTLIAPSAFCIRRGWPFVPKIAASWILAVALLAASIPLLIDHPGYVPDHRM